MGRYILRYLASQSAPADHVASIRAQPGVRVIDATSRMLLVDGAEPALREALKQLPGWSLHEEQTIQRPDPRQKTD